MDLVSILAPGLMVGPALRGTTILPVIVFEYSHPSSLSLFHTIYDLSQGVG